MMSTYIMQFLNDLIYLTIIKPKSGWMDRISNIICHLFHDNFCYVTAMTYFVCVLKAKRLLGNEIVCALI